MQLTGAVMWAPLLLVGAIGGLVSDRFDRLKTVQIQLAVLIPLVVLIGWAERADQLSLWLLYPFLLIAGTGWVGDMTSRRALVMDLVGQSHLHRAMSLETISLASGIAIGNLLGGSVADALGVGAAFYVVAGLLMVALLLLTFVPPEAERLAAIAQSELEQSDAQQPSPAQPSPTQSGPVQPSPEPHNVHDPHPHRSALKELREGLSMVHTNRTLRSILGITVLTNAFYFSYFPTVQRVGDRLNATPTQIGVIASMTGFGMVIGSLITATTVRKRLGVAYVIGAVVAMLLLIPFGTAPNVPFAAIALLASSAAIGLFAATQSTLVLTNVAADKSGRAMGMLSMSIGALPIGTFVLGEVAEQIGAGMALVSMPSVGIVALALWLIPSREVLHCHSPAPAAVRSPQAG